MSYQQNKFKEIADKIRKRTGTTDPIIPKDFASKIDDVYEAGLAAGGGETLPDADVMTFPNDITGKVSTDSQYYDDIANKIRRYGDAALGDKFYKPSEMVEGIKMVADENYGWGYGAGEEQGYYDGFDVGYGEGENAGYLQGRQELETELLGGAW